NGIIENYLVLKKALKDAGHKFITETDTEVLAHLIEEHLKRGMKLEKAVVSADEPGVVVGARHGSPLVVGVSDGEYFLASDVSPIVEHTRQVIYLDDGEMVTLTPDGLHTSTIAHDPVDKQVHEVEWDLAQIEKG